MTTFTIDAQNQIVAFATPEQATAATATPFDTFTTHKELAELAAPWPAGRLLAIWNTVPGVTPASKCKNTKTLIARIWKRIQGLAEPATPKAAPTARTGAPAPKGAPVRRRLSRKATPAPKAKKAKTRAHAQASAPRSGSKAAQMITLLRRKNGATLAEIVEKMGWQKHTVRGFMAGAMKKAGYAVESFKPAGGQRTYRLPS